MCEWVIEILVNKYAGDIRHEQVISEMRLMFLQSGRGER